MTYLKTITEFVQANYDYYKDKLIGTPNYIKEQVLYRLSQCKDDCVVYGKCIICNCATEKKSWSQTSCNPDRFPDRMNKEQWEQFKKENGI